MVLTTLHWPDEIRSTKELDLPAEEFDFKPAERKMAEQLVEAMTDDFDATKYKDEYREALLQVIEAKVAGVEIEAPEPQEESSSLVDLMKLLQDSVKQATDQKTKGAPVSVAEAKKERESRPASARSKANAKTAAKATADEDEAEEAKPARRRKSA
jgi:DNA end-binding protein Ku